MQCQTAVPRRYPDLLTSLFAKRHKRRDADRLRRLRHTKRHPSWSRLKRFETALQDSMGRRGLELFKCPVCRNVLRAPVTVECGHTVCEGCLGCEGTCVQCGDGVAVTCSTDQHHQRNVNVLVQDLVEKWRERRGNFVDGVPGTADILGIEPRYHLRSGYAGLQINNEPEAKFKHYLPPISTEKFSRSRKQRRLDESSPYSLRQMNISFLEKENRGDFQQTLNEVFKEVDDIKEEAVKFSWNCVSPSDLECILCSRCLLEPVTTGCGHTFCRECLTRVLDHKLACPLCMAPLKVTDYSRTVTEVLDHAIRFLIPEEFSERMKISLRESMILEKNSDVPVFVCTNAFPGVACPLFVYEPRYRLLTRRCLRSPTKRFAMAGKGGGERFASFGTILEMRDAVRLEDGRFILTTVGVRRFRVVSRGEQDGYDTAKVHYIKDSAVPPEKLPELTLLHQKVRNKAVKWLRTLKPKVLLEVERLIGKMPRVEENWPNLPDGPAWTWWLMPILPLSSQLQVGFLSTQSLEKRLRAIDKMLEHMKIRMMAVERKSVPCSADEDNSDSCMDTESNIEMPYNP